MSKLVVDTCIYIGEKNEVLDGSKTDIIEAHTGDIHQLGVYDDNEAVDLGKMLTRMLVVVIFKICHFKKKIAQMLKKLPNFCSDRYF